MKRPLLQKGQKKGLRRKVPLVIEQEPRFIIDLTKISLSTAQGVSTPRTSII